MLKSYIQFSNYYFLSDDTLLFYHNAIKMDVIADRQTES